MEENGTLKVEEAAKALNVSKEWLRNAIEKKVVPFGVCMKTGSKRKFVITKKEFFDYIGN